MRRLDLVVGPNGAGKSTFVSRTLGPSLPPRTVFVNADEIARARWPHDPAGNSYAAAEVAAATRRALVAAGESFMAETVFSHSSKLELITAAGAAGYSVFLHVLVVPEELAVRRVAQRVAAGGHTVPEEKIRARYARLWPLVRDAMHLVESATVYDNSRLVGPKILVRLAGGAPVGAVTWPDWGPVELATAWTTT